MRALLVGCGAMATAWADAVQKNELLRGRVELAGLVDPDPVAAKKLAADHGLSDLPVFSNMDDALGQVQAEIVFDVTPPEARADIVRKAIISGCHVLSEKPMAANMAAARGLAELAKENQRVFSVTQNRRYKHGVRRIEAFLASGALGEPTGLHADFFIGARFGGFRDQMAHVLLLDMAIHHFDAARFMIGKNARNVFCRETNPAGSWYDADASAFATFEMSGGCFFTYRGSWCAQGQHTSWDAAWRITGTLGNLIWDGEDKLEAYVAHGEETFLRESMRIDVPELDSNAQTQGHASVLAAFLDSIETGRPPETDSTDNLHSMAMVFGAIQSAETGQLINIPKDFQTS